MNYINHNIEDSELLNRFRITPPHSYSELRDCVELAARECRSRGFEDKENYSHASGCIEFRLGWIDIWGTRLAPEDPPIYFCFGGPSCMGGTKWVNEVALLEWLDKMIEKRER